MHVHVKSCTSCCLACSPALPHVWQHLILKAVPGSRLTAYELVHDGLPATLIADSAAAALLAAGRVDAIVVGADRVAANGDTANKIGTLSLSVLAAHYRHAAPPSMHNVHSCNALNQHSCVPTALHVSVTWTSIVILLSRFSIPCCCSDHCFSDQK